MFIGHKSAVKNLPLLQTLPLITSGHEQFKKQQNKTGSFSASWTITSALSAISGINASTEDSLLKCHIRKQLSYYYKHVDILITFLFEISHSIFDTSDA
jgi:hypothetical protein